MGGTEIEPKIYVVEPSPDIQELIEEELRDEGFLCLEIVKTVEEIYSVLGQLTPALVIVDLANPLKPTVEEKNLFGDLRQRGVPSLAFDSSLPCRPDLETIEERKALLGATAVMPRPFALEEFIRLVKSLIDSRDFQTDKPPS